MSMFKEMNDMNVSNKQKELEQHMYENFVNGLFGEDFMLAEAFNVNRFIDSLEDELTDTSADEEEGIQYDTTLTLDVENIEDDQDRVLETEDDLARFNANTIRTDESPSAEINMTTEAFDAILNNLLSHKPLLEDVETISDSEDCDEFITDKGVDVVYDKDIELESSELEMEDECVETGSDESEAFKEEDPERFNTNSVKTEDEPSSEINMTTEAFDAILNNLLSHKPLLEDVEKVSENDDRHVFTTDKPADIVYDKDIDTDSPEGADIIISKATEDMMDVVPSDNMEDEPKIVGSKIEKKIYIKKGDKLIEKEKEIKVKNEDDDPGFDEMSESEVLEVIGENALLSELFESDIDLEEMKKNMSPTKRKIYQGMVNDHKKAVNIIKSIIAKPENKKYKGLFNTNRRQFDKKQGYYVKNQLEIGDDRLNIAVSKGRKKVAVFLVMFTGMGSVFTSYKYGKFVKEIRKELESKIKPSAGYTITYTRFKDFGLTGVATATTMSIDSLGMRFNITDPKYLSESVSLFGETNDVVDMEPLDECDDVDVKDVITNDDDQLKAFDEDDMTTVRMNDKNNYDMDDPNAGPVHGSDIDSYIESASDDEYYDDDTEHDFVFADIGDHQIGNKK